MSYETLTPSTQLGRDCPSPEDETWFAKMGWFFLLAGHQLKSLHLNNVIVPLQVVEQALEDVEKLEVLSITESLLLEDAPIYPPALIDPGSKLRKSLCVLSLRFCSGATHPLLRLFKAFREGGKLAHFQFEQIDGIWFDWDKNGTFDDGSSVPAIIEKMEVSTFFTRRRDRSQTALLLLVQLLSLLGRSSIQFDTSSISGLLKRSSATTHMSNSEPPDPLSAASGPPLTNAMGPTMSGPSNKNASSSTLSLPGEMVNKIGNHMELADLKPFRMTSKTMCKHLDFNMKEHFKVIKCRFQQVVFDALSRFKNQPLAQAVESLIWLKAPGPDGLDEQVEFERMMWRAGLLPELDETFREEENREAQDADSEVGPPEMSHEDQQRLIAQSVIGLPNLRTLGLIFEEDPEAINFRPHDEDVKFWAEAVRQLERPLESLVQTEKGDFGVYWTGSRKSSNTLFFKTSHTVQNLNEEESFRELFPVLDMLLGQGLKSLELYRTSVLLEDIVYFCDHTRNLEEVKIMECAGFCWQYDFGVMAADKSRFRKTVRRLTLSDCTLRPQDPDGLIKSQRPLLPGVASI
ncbi:hypothetical protein BKA80DRAFT_346596 [Phyllosticta citrichinensis]